jgi:hypothetical protein
MQRSATLNGQLSNRPPNKAGTPESSQRAEGWVKQNACAPFTPLIIEGGTVLHF